MGFFAIIFSLVIVTIQMTSILMDRKAHKWTFPLLSMTPNTTYLTELNTLFESNPANRLMYMNTEENGGFNGQYFSNNSNDKNGSNSSGFQYNIDVILYNETKSAMAQAVCLKTAWSQRNGKLNDIFPRYCMFNTHLRQEIKPVMKDFNPHIILLTLCIVHSIFCIARIKRTVWSTANIQSALPSRLASFLPRYGVPAKATTKIGIEHPHVISPVMSIGVLSILLIIVLIIESTRKSELVEYPTIIIVVFEILASIWFVLWLPFITSTSSGSSNNNDNDGSNTPIMTNSMEDDKNEHKLNWTNFYHLQLVAVPVAVLSIVSVGARFWTDALFHVIFLSVACNALYMERELIDNMISKKLLQLIYVFLPVFCLYMAHMQWGNFDNWRYVIGIMGSFSVIPFFIHPCMGGYSNSEKLKEPSSKNKYIGKLSSFASSAALLSLVVNLAMFYDE